MEEGDVGVVLGVVELDVDGACGVFRFCWCNLLGYDDYGSQGDYQCRENRD